MVHVTSYWMSSLPSRPRTPLALIASLSGPIEKPSPMTSSVTPWRDVALRAAIFDQTFHCPGHHIDEARRDRQPVHVELLLAGERAGRANLGDTIALQCEIADDRGASAAVVKGAAAQNTVMNRHVFATVLL
ncbi:MAG: hypothetical protein IPK19_10090 [Chloroflexi bacterium]|nr:hypothetical protein [Chloroflexota bacterium]